MTQAFYNELLDQDRISEGAGYPASSFSALERQAVRRSWFLATATPQTLAWNEAMNNAIQYGRPFKWWLPDRCAGCSMPLGPEIKERGLFRYHAECAQVLDEQGLKRLPTDETPSYDWIEP